MDEATLCLGDMLDSRAVVGPGEYTLLPGHVREYGHYGGLQESEVFCWVLSMNSRCVVSSLDISVNPVTMEAFRELTLLWWILLIIRAPLQPLFIFGMVKGPLTGPTITLLTP